MIYLGKRIPIDEMRKYIEDNSNCKLISKECENVRTLLTLKCECGEEFQRTFLNIKKNKVILCRSCITKRINQLNTKNQNDAFDIIDSKYKDKYVIIPFDYIGKQKTEVDLVCKKCNHKFTRNYHRLRFYDVPCPSCESYYKTWSIKRAQNLINKYSEDYRVIECNNANDIYIEHIPCGHIFKRASHNIYQNGGAKCPKCINKESIGSETITKWLDEKGFYYIKEYRFSDCRNIRPLPFDFYLPDHDICIEYDGEQHFRPVRHLGGKDHYDKTVKNDKIKNDYCRDNNIELIRISYYENKNISNILEEYFKHVNTEVI